MPQSRLPKPTVHDAPDNMPPIGCNLLYPFGTLHSPNTAAFGVEAHRAALARVQACGYRYVEYSHVSHCTGTEIEAIAAATRDDGLLPWSMHATGQLHPTNRQEWLSAKRKEVAWAHALGCRVLVLHIGHDTAETEWAQALAAYQTTLTELCKLAADQDVYIGVENTSNRFDRLVALVDAVPAENLGFVLDTGHAALHGSVTATLDAMGERLISTHLHDNFGQVDEHLPPGIGLIDWPSALQGLRRCGYAGPLMLELTDLPRNRLYDQETELKQGLLNITTFWRMHPGN
jgi:sugar phosphate isomerase/epimerase